MSFIINAVVTLQCVVTQRYMIECVLQEACYFPNSAHHITDTA